MLLVGLILIVLGALVIVSAVFSLEIVGGDIELLSSIELSPLALFLLGVGSVAAILFGLSVSKWGTKRGLARRREQKKMDELSEKLGEADARRHDISDHADEDRPTL